MLYTLNLYSDVCQLYLNKTEKKYCDVLPHPPKKHPEGGK